MTDCMKGRALGIYASRELVSRVRNVARETGRTISSVVRVCLVRGLSDPATRAALGLAPDNGDTEG